MNAGMPRPLDQDRRRWIAALPLLATGLFLRPALADPTVQRASRPLMGTQVDIVAHGPDAVAVQAAMAQAFAEMERLERMLSRYRADSLVARLQSNAGGTGIAIAPEMRDVLKMAHRVSEISNGAFDITVGAYSGWNFDPAGGKIPSDQELARERKLVDYRDVVLDEKNSRALLRHPDMKIDLGGIAKLPILQAGMQVLQRHGVRNAMLNGGGDVLVQGQLQGRDWRVGVRDPRAPEKLLGVITLSEGFVAASGDYERCFDREGQRYHHILDPKTGKPSHGPHGVTLVSRELESINGLGAAVMVMGSAAGRQMLASRPGVDALIVETQPWLSSGMKTRLQLRG